MALALLLLPWPMALLARDAQGIESHLLLLGGRAFALRRLPPDPFVLSRVALPGQVFGGVYRPNVVLVQLEEIPFPGFGRARNGRETAPFLTELAAREPRNFRSLPRHYSNSGCTEVALYTMLVGVDPTHDGRALGRAPAAWDYLNAADYTTLLGVPWDMHWADIGKRLSRADGSVGLDRVMDTSSAELPFDYEIAVQDERVVDWFLGELPALAQANRPFFAVINLQSTHERGFAVEALGAFQFACGRDGTGFDDWECALYEEDFQISRIVARLRALGLQDDTVLLITPDHGQDPRDHLARLESFRQDIVHVPMFVYLPEHLLERRPELVLQEDKVTQHVDVLPTLLDLAAVERDSTNAAYLDMLSGSSLFSPAAPRAVYFLSVNALRGWPHLGFGILYDGRLKYIVRDGTPELFDLHSDPGERHSLMGKPGFERELGEIEWLVEQNPRLRAIAHGD